MPVWSACTTNDSATTAAALAGPSSDAVRPAGPRWRLARSIRDAALEPSGKDHTRMSLPLLREEMENVRAFRTAAAQVRTASIIDEGKDISIGTEVTPDGTIRQTHELLENEPFRSLAMSIRLVYMQGEGANYGRICNLIRRKAPDTVQNQIDILRQRYNSLINGKKFQFQLHGAFEGRTVSTREVFEAWLYGGAFHQEPEYQPIYQELLNFGPNFVFAVNAIALELAGCILDLDDVIADVVGEPRVPRIGGS